MLLYSVQHLFLALVNIFLTIYPGDGGKEKRIPLIQGPSDTRDLHNSKWLKESRKPESLFAPDWLAFTIQIPQCKDYSFSSGKCQILGKNVPRRRWKNFMSM